MSTPEKDTVGEHEGQFLKHSHKQQLGRTYNYSRSLDNQNEA